MPADVLRGHFSCYNIEVMGQIDHSFFKPVHKARRPVSSWWILVLVAFAWRLTYAYWPPLFDHYLVPAGDDAAFHISQIAVMMSGKWALFASNGYPLGFHMILAVLAKLTGLSAMKAVIWLTPPLLALPVIIIYFVGKALFESELVGAVAAAAWGIMALAPVRGYSDGNYPDLLAASIFLPLAILFIYRAVNTPKLKYFIASLFFVIAILLVHHLSLGFLIVIISPWLVIMLLEKMWEARKDFRVVKIALTSLLSLIALAVLLWAFYHTLLTPYLDVLRNGGNLSGFLGGDSGKLTWSLLLEINNPALVIVGLVGMLAIMISPVRRSLKLLMASWVLMLLLFSVGVSVGLTGRFARELAIPFALSIGYLAQFLSNHTAPKLRHAVIPLVITFFFSTVWVSGFNRPFALPDPFQPLMRLQHDEEPAIPIIINNTASSEVVIANNSNPFLEFLLPRTTIVIHDPATVPSVIANYSSATIYVAVAPPFSQGYPFFQDNAAVSDALRALPNLTLVRKLPNRSAIYHYTKR